MFDDLHVSVAAEELFSIGPLPVTNSLLQMLIVMALLILFGAFVASRLRDTPGRLQSAVELIVEYLMNLAELAGGKKIGRAVFPLMASLFIFIIVANYSGLLPGVGTIGSYHTEVEHADESTAVDEGHPVEEGTSITSTQQTETAPFVADAESEPHETLVPWFRGPNADLNMTLAMALVSFVAIQVLGIKYSGGVGKRLKHMAEPAFMFPIEVISELSRLVSLTARLFGNVFAGEVLMTLMFTIAAGLRAFIIPFAIPVVFFGLELLFGFIQAIVFALLTLIYIKLAAGHGGDDHAEDHELPHPEATPRALTTSPAD